MSLEYLKILFKRKYGSALFLKIPTTVRVMLTYDQYRDLSNDLIRILPGEDRKAWDLDKLSYTQISIPDMCDFIVELGEEFVFQLDNLEDEPGTEDL